jgi:acetyltransferase-like isoleucine patch superfamily enzyme
MPSSETLPHDWFPRPLPENVQIGPRSWLYSSFAFLHYRSQSDCGVRIGHDTGIYNGSFFDLDVQGEVVIGNYCTLVGAVLATNGRISIGDYTFIAHEVTIADHFAAAPAEAAAHLNPRDRRCGISIGSNVWIGARAILLPGAEIGEGSIVGAACVLNTSIPPFSTVTGNPARVSPHSGHQRRTEGSKA